MFCKFRNPVALNEEEAELVNEAVRTNQNSIILNGNVYQLAGVQTATTMREAEDIWGSMQALKRCKFGNWHGKFHMCRCDKAVSFEEYRSPLHEFNFYQEWRKNYAKRLLKDKDQHKYTESDVEFRLELAGCLLIYTKKTSEYSIKVDGNMKTCLNYGELLDLLPRDREFVLEFSKMTSAISQANLDEFNALTPDQKRSMHKKTLKELGDTDEMFKLNKKNN